MKDIIINYTDSFTNWENKFKEKLDEAGVLHTDEMIYNICSSLSNTIIAYLSANGYRPNNTYSYRVGLAKRLEKHGLAISIRTNALLWKYLEYFTDLTDYSKCFDIKIYIDNIDIATKDLIFVGVSTNKLQGMVPQPIYSEEYAKITQKLDLLKVMVKNELEPKLIKEIVEQITDMLEYLIRRTD